MSARIMTNLNPDLIEQAAKAMADDWNPDRDPILSAMFRDYAATAIAAVAPFIAAQVLRDAAGSSIPRGALARETRSWLRDRADQIEEER